MFSRLRSRPVPSQTTAAVSPYSPIPVIRWNLSGLRKFLKNILHLLPEEESFPRCFTEYRNVRATLGHAEET